LGYSGEIAVSEDHFMVAVRVTQNASDNASLLPMMAEVERQCRARPQKGLADSGFYRGENLDQLKARVLDGYVPDSNLARELNTGHRAGVCDEIVCGMEKRGRCGRSCVAGKDARSTCSARAWWNR
jgi:hypothetical protein